MPHDERKRWKEIIDASSRAARSEESDPPPIPSPYPPTREGRAGEGSPSATIRRDIDYHLNLGGKRGKALAGIVAGLVALYTVGRPIFDWFASRPSDKELEQVKTYCAGVAASAAASAVAPPGQPSFAQRFTDIEKKVAHEAERWDTFDKFLKQNFQRRNAPPICQFGPKAESKGNACTVEEAKTP